MGEGLPLKPLDSLTENTVSVVDPDNRVPGADIYRCVLTIVFRALVIVVYLQSCSGREIVIVVY